MGEKICAVAIQYYGTVYGKPVLRMGNLVEIRDPRLFLERRSPEGKLVGYEFGVIIGNPESLQFPRYLVNFEVKDDEIVKHYFESITGLKLAPNGIKLV